MTANPLWDYATTLYSAPAVAERCLALQDAHAANVNLLLLCCWAGQAGVILDIPALRSAEEVVAEWEKRMVVPLRLQRRRLDLSRSGCREERQRLLTEELQAERREHDLLQAWFSKREQGERYPLRSAIAANLANYARLLAIPEADIAGLRDATLAGG